LCNFEGKVVFDIFDVSVRGRALEGSLEIMEDDLEIMEDDLEMPRKHPKKTYN
jgi:hypothetical protein